MTGIDPSVTPAMITEERELELIQSEYMALWRMVRTLERRRGSGIRTIVDAFWRFHKDHPNAKSWVADK